MQRIAIFILLILFLTSSALGITLSTRTVTAGYSKGTSYQSYYSEIAAASCGLNEALVGGGVECNHKYMSLSTTNTGTIKTAIPVGRTYMGTCTADQGSATYSTSKYGPAITVYAICLSKYAYRPTEGEDQNSNVDKEALKKLEMLKKEMSGAIENY